MVENLTNVLAKFFNFKLGSIGLLDSKFMEYIQPCPDDVLSPKVCP